MAAYLAPIDPVAGARTRPDASKLLAAITAWTPGIKPTWTVSEVRNALRSHRDGDFSLSALLVDTMGEDDAIPGLLEKYVDALLESDFELSPVTETKGEGKKSEEVAIPASQKIVDELEDDWWDMVPETELDEFLRWYRMLGVSVAVLDWDTTTTPWTARLRTLHPQYLRYDCVAERWIYYAREGEFTVTPGDGRWVLLTDGRRGWMRGLVRSLGITWLGKQLTWRDLLRFCERHGLPIIKAYTPAIADESDKDDFWEQLRALHSEIVADLPTHLDDNGAKFDLDLLEAKDQSWKVFLDTLERCDRRFTINFLGGNLSTEVTDQGARATADTHRGVERSKAQALGKRASTELRRQVVWPWAAFNVRGSTLAVTPWPHWSTEPTEDLKGQAEGKKTLGEALNAIQDAGWRVKNVDEVATPYGLELEELPPQAPFGGPRPPGPPGAPPPPAPGAPLPAAKQKALARGRLLLGSGADVRDNRGFIAGQLYADAATDSVTREGSRVLAVDLQALARVLDEASSFDAVRRGLITLLGEDYDPDELAELMGRAVLLSELAGAFAVRQDIPELEAAE